MSQSATGSIPFAVPTPLPLDVDFLGGRRTSDGGLPWVAEADHALGLCQTLADQIPDWRTWRGQHATVTLLTQRVYQIACGYEDQNDATHLRTDPLLKLVCGRLPDSDPELASQPTLSRLETSISARTCYRLAAALGEVYLRERERDGVPRQLVLDLDGTDDPTHGQQEGIAYHGYYHQYQYFPVLVFDADTDQLVTAVLRPGTVHASQGIVPILRRITTAVRARWPGVTIEIRADSGFAVPALYDYCEAERITYTLGLATNARLAALVAPMEVGAERQYAATQTKVRLLDEVTYQADPGRIPGGWWSRSNGWPRGSTRGSWSPPDAARQRGSMPGTRPWRERELDQGPQARLFRRPPQLSPLLGQPVPAALACGRVLAAYHRAPLVDGCGGGAHDADHPAPADHQDRGVGAPAGRPRPAAAGQ